jgi:hypothetical protein
MKNSLCLIAVLVFVLTGATSCASNSDGLTSPTDSVESTNVTTTPEETATDVTAIILGDIITINGAGASVNEEGVTITSTGTYKFSGTLEDGMVQVDAAGETVELILDGATITSSDSPAILFSEVGEAIVTLQEGTVNTLADGGNSDFDAALYSNGTITIRGEGDLNVTGSNNEGISSVMHINIGGGNIRVIAVEDGLNANNDNVSVITISGGYLYVESESGDGIDSNGDITITGGTLITLSALADASGGLDADGDVTISGGTVIATGSRLSVPGASSPQKSLLVTYDTTQQANTLVSIQEDGRQILTFAPAKDYQSLLYSSDSIADDISYDVYTGGSATGDMVDGLYPNAEYTPGTLVTTVTTESINNASRGGP